MFGSGTSRPEAVAFDVIGTTFPLEPLRPRLTELGLPPTALEGWFAAALRDAFALAAAGDFAPFPQVLEAALDGVLAEQGLPPSEATQDIVAGLADLMPRLGAVKAYRDVADAGLPVVALTNGSVQTTGTLLERAGLRGTVTHIVSVDDVRRSKPAPEVYHLGARMAGVKPKRLALVAAHPWDINGAKAAGLTTAYLSADRPFSPVMRKPDVEDSTLPGCVRALLAL